MRLGQELNLGFPFSSQVSVPQQLCWVGMVVPGYYHASLFFGVGVMELCEASQRLLVAMGTVGLGEGSTL